MKKLFTTEKVGIFMVEAEGAVYRMFCDSLHKHIFFDNNGREIENYVRPLVQDKKHGISINDSAFFEEIGEGFYVYTTHEVGYDPDGTYGKFGIRSIDGKNLNEEIYYQVGRFYNGLCAVSIEADKWGCIDLEGNLVIPYIFDEALFFNKYGVAVGNKTLIDITGREIPDTNLNCIEACEHYDRYYIFSFLTDEQLNCDDDNLQITVDVYDTKNRIYVVKGIAEDSLDVSFFDGETEVVLAAAGLLEEYDRIRLSGKGTIICEKNGYITVYDFYQ